MWHHKVTGQARPFFIAFWILLLATFSFLSMIESELVAEQIYGSVEGENLTEILGAIDRLEKMNGIQGVTVVNFISLSWIEDKTLEAWE